MDLFPLVFNLIGLGLRAPAHNFGGFEMFGYLLDQLLSALKVIALGSIAIYCLVGFALVLFYQAV